MIERKEQTMNEKPPDGLEKAGKALWAAFDVAVVLEPGDRELLLEACRVKDRLDALSAEVAESGAVVGGKPNPCLAECRQLQLVLAKLLHTLRPVEAPAGGSVSAAASNAASARWAKQRRVAS